MYCCCPAAEELCSYFGLRKDAAQSVFSQAIENMMAWYRDFELVQEAKRTQLYGTDQALLKWSYRDYLHSLAESARSRLSFKSVSSASHFLTSLKDEIKAVLITLSFFTGLGSGFFSLFYLSY